MKPRPGVMLRSPGSSKDSLPLLDAPASPAQRLPGAGNLHWPHALQRSQPLKCIVMLVLTAILLLNLLWLGQQSAPAWGQERLEAGSPKTYTLMQRPSLKDVQQQQQQGEQQQKQQQLEGPGPSSNSPAVLGSADEPQQGLQEDAGSGQALTAAAPNVSLAAALTPEGSSVVPTAERSSGGGGGSSSSPPAQPPQAEAGSGWSSAAKAVVEAAKRTFKQRPAGKRGRGKQQGRPLTATLRLPEVDPASDHSCSQELQTPRVALLFLTKGELFHEPTWRLWFESAAGVLPAASTRDGGACAPNASVPDLQSACNASDGKDDPISRQHLFSVYIHAPPRFDLPGLLNVTDYPEGSLWRGRMVSTRITPGWGDISLVEASRHLLWEAFKDPLNTRFVLLSESGLPLYDPLTMYAQLMAESGSRVGGGCPRWEDMAGSRWSWRMQLPNMKRSHWRKSSQWFALVRSHVELVLKDVEVFRRFEGWCWNGWDADYNRWRSCYADEHYFATLLGGVHGLGKEVQCLGYGVTSTDWSAGGSHPKTYGPGDVAPELFTHVRSMAAPCNASLAQEQAQAQFVHVSDLLGPESRNETCAMLTSPGGVPPFNTPLSNYCFLFARKFPKDTVPAIYRLFTDRDSGLQLLDGGVCSAAEPLSEP